MKFKQKGRTRFFNRYTFEVINNNQKTDVEFRISPYANERQICIYDRNYTKYKCILWLKNDTIFLCESNDILNIKEMKQLLSRCFGV